MTFKCNERIIVTIGAFTVLITLCVLTVSSAEESHNISELSWLSGHWQTKPKSTTQIEEHWTEPAGATMVGMGRTVVGEKTTEFEYLRIEQRENSIYYVASPNGRCPATDFKLVKLTSEEVIFANPQHDFPKRVIYRKAGKNSITASIDGGEGTKSMTFPYQRMK